MPLSTGYSRKRKKPLSIELKISGGRMLLCIDNFISYYQKDKVGGIGVQNVKKRLDLLYGDRYRIDVDHTKDRYVVKLNLPL